MLCISMFLSVSMSHIHFRIDMNLHIHLQIHIHIQSYPLLSTSMFLSISMSISISRSMWKSISIYKSISISRHVRSYPFHIHIHIHMEIQFTCAILAFSNQIQAAQIVLSGICGNLIKTWLVHSADICNQGILASKRPWAKLLAAPDWFHVAGWHTCHCGRHMTLVSYHACPMQTHAAVCPGGFPLWRMNLFVGSDGSTERNCRETQNLHAQSCSAHWRGCFQSCVGLYTVVLCGTE